MATRPTHGTEFSRILSRLRRESGHGSARDFYRGNGGRAFFGCSYEQYLNVEGGRSLPQPPLLAKTAIALRVWLKQGAAREFFTAYLRLLFKDEEALGLLTQALSGQGGTPTPLRQAIQKNTEARRVELTRQQAQTIFSRPASFWCFNVFANDEGDWSAPELSQLLGFPPPSVRAALRGLKREGLVVEPEPGRYKCFSEIKVFWFPNTALFNRDAGKKTGTYRSNVEALARRRGTLELYEPLVLRASSAALRQYFPYLTQTVLGADIYSTTQRGADTGLYSIETFVRKLVDF